MDCIGLSGNRYRVNRLLVGGHFAATTLSSTRRSSD
jgi:hypothetical protein